jgi:hypothetical protein
VGCRDLERDDVYALSYALNVASVRGVPERGGVTLVGFGGKEEFKGDVCGGRGVVEERAWVVVRADVGA